MDQSCNMPEPAFASKCQVVLIGVPYRSAHCPSGRYLPVYGAPAMSSSFVASGEKQVLVRYPPAPLLVVSSTRPECGACRYKRVLATGVCISTHTSSIMYGDVK